MNKKILILTILTSLIGFLFGQITLFTEDFNVGSSGWTFVNGEAANKWVHGTAAVGNSSGAMYISSAPVGTPYPVHNYLNHPIANSSRVYLYRDLPHIPANAINITLTFDVIGGGESSFDYLKVYLQPTSFVPIPKFGTIVGSHDTGSDEYTENHLVIPGTNPWFNQANGTNPNSWTSISLPIPFELAAGQTKRLVFMWRNDHAEGTQPPIGIDNIAITYNELSLEPPAALLVAPANNSTNVFLNQTLQWSTTPEGVPPTGYKIFFDTVNPPNIMTDLGFIHVWTPSPSLIANTTYYWQIVPYNIYGDAIDTPIWSFTTNSQGFVQIGEGTVAQQPAPWYPWWRYNYTQTLYIANEINRPNESLITSISYQHNGGRAETDSISVYMGYTDLYSFPPASPTSWIDQSDLSVVFEGTVYTTNTPQWMEIQLDTPFLYDDTRNLVIAILDNFNNDTLVNTSSFLGTSGVGNRTQYIRNDETPIDLSALGIPTVVTSITNTRLNFSAPPDGPIISTPAWIDFGKVTQLSPITKNLIVRNFGNQNLVISSIDTPIEASISPNNANIPPSGFQTFEVTFTPTNLGQYSNVITIESNANNGSLKNIPLRAMVYPPNVTYIGDEYSQTRVTYTPFEFSQRNGIVQTIYLEQEMALTRPVEITHLTYNLSATGGIPTNSNIAIFMTTTLDRNFETPQSWIPRSNFDMVYQGPLPATTAGINEIVIELTTPFDYIGGNLVIMTHKPVTTLNYLNNLWQVSPSGGNNTLYIRDDVTTLNMENLAFYSGNLYSYKPNIMFTWQDEEYPRPLNLSGQVINDAISLSWDPPYIPENTPPRPVTGYKVYRNNIMVAQYGQNTFTFTDNDVIENIVYRYHVTALYNNLESKPSNNVSISITGDILHPPANLTYTNPNQTNVRLNWEFGELIVNENFEGLLDSWTIVDQWETTTGYAKEGFQSIMSTSTAIITNNWLISPPFNPVVNSYLNFWVAVTDPTALGERFLVKISTTGTNQNNFTHTLIDTLITNVEWTRMSINLSEFTGQQIHFAFQHNTFNSQTRLLIDGVQVLKPISNPSYTPLGFKIYINEAFVGQTNGNTLTYLVTSPPAGVNGYYVTTLYDNGVESYPGNIRYIDPLVSENDHPIELTATILKGNYPNPFNPETTINFTLAKESKIRIDVYNIKGQKMITLVDEVKNSGEHNVVWKGTDSSGNQAASGIYLYQLRTEDYTAVKRMVLMK